jgi:Bacterial extracellular solute-binding protein
LLVKAQGADVSELRAYGPGGPLEPIRECARAFSNQEGVQVTVTGEPEEQWIAQARKDADVVFGGADYTLTQLTLKYPDLVNPLTRTELYTRGAVILVRKGNPKNIAEFKDLARPGVKIVDVNGAGQVGLWEDIASLAGVADPRNRSPYLLRAALPRSTPGEPIPRWTRGLLTAHGITGCHKRRKSLRSRRIADPAEQPLSPSQRPVPILLSRGSLSIT